MPKKLKPFAFCGYDQNGEAIMKDLKHINPADVPGTIVNPDPSGPSSGGPPLDKELEGFSKNPTWVKVGGRWYRIG